MQQRQEKGVGGSQVLVLGLDGAGKTSLLQCFATGNVEQEVSPTQGFHAVVINRNELQIKFLESMHATYTQHDSRFLIYTAMSSEKLNI